MKEYIITKTTSDGKQTFDLADNYQDAKRIYLDALEPQCKVNVYLIGGDATGVFMLAYID